MPIALDTAAGLDSVQLRLAFDNDALELRNVRKGDLTADFDWLVDRSVPGILSVDMARLSALQSGQGNLLELDFHVRDGVAAGSYRLDLQWASLNDGRLTLNPAPKAGIDLTDGSIQVQQRLPHRLHRKNSCWPRTRCKQRADGCHRPTQPVIDWSADARKSEILTVRVSATRAATQVVAGFRRQSRQERRRAQSESKDQAEAADGRLGDQAAGLD